MTKLKGPLWRIQWYSAELQTKPPLLSKHYNIRWPSGACSIFILPTPTYIDARLPYSKLNHKYGFPNLIASNSKHWCISLFFLVFHGKISWQTYPLSSAAHHGRLTPLRIHKWLDLSLLFVVTDNYTLSKTYSWVTHFISSNKSNSILHSGPLR